MANTSKKPQGNGLKTFTLHTLDENFAPAVAALESERPGLASFAAVATDAAPTDPESSARRYLTQALASSALPELETPVTDGKESEFKMLGVESVPVAGTTTVKFRQTVKKVPIYGSLVTVELDENNQLLGISSSLGQPTGVSAVAKISAAEAVKAVAAYSGTTKFKKDLSPAVPRLVYCYDGGRSKWRLAFLLEDVPVVATGSADEPKPSMMDYFVDAHTGTVFSSLPRTSTMAAVVVTASDGLGVSRQITVEKVGTSNTMLDRSLNIQTFDFENRDPIVQENLLPGKSIADSPPFSPSAISAHANASEVASFMRTVLKRNNIDNVGGAMRSSINCVVRKESPDGKQWLNAFWNGRQMVYGQRLSGSKLLSMSIALDIVAHEMFHGITDRTSRLEYANQSGALNESYSDIFGVLVANGKNPDPKTWNWLIGNGLSANGKPFRDMSNPRARQQPDHMNGFKFLPNTENGDYGGVHTNSGIHNKAAFNLITTRRTDGSLLFAPRESAALFYYCLTQMLSRTSTFAESRAGMLQSARTLFRTLPPAQRDERVQAVANAYAAVGIN